MKKTLLLFFLCVLIIGCSADSSKIKNMTDRTVYISYTKEGNSERFLAEILPQKDITFSGFLDELSTIKSTEEPGVIDNAFFIYGKSLIKAILNATEIQYAIKNNIPSAQYTGEKIYLTDANGKMGRYTPSEENRIELTEGLVTSTTVYGTPDFILVNDAGDKVTTFGGYPVNIRIENGVVYIE